MPRKSFQRSGAWSDQLRRSGQVRLFALEQFFPDRTSSSDQARACEVLSKRVNSQLTDSPVGARSSRDSVSDDYGAGARANARLRADFSVRNHIHTARRPVARISRASLKPKVLAQERFVILADSWNGAHRADKAERGINDAPSRRRGASPQLEKGWRPRGEGRRVGRSGVSPFDLLRLVVMVLMRRRDDCVAWRAEIGPVSQQAGVNFAMIWNVRATEADGVVLAGGSLTLQVSGLRQGGRRHGDADKSCGESRFQEHLKPSFPWKHRIDLGRPVRRS